MAWRKATRDDGWVIIEELLKAHPVGLRSDQLAVKVGCGVGAEFNRRMKYARELADRMGPGNIKALLVNKPAIAALVTAKFPKGGPFQIPRPTERNGYRFRLVTDAKSAVPGTSRALAQAAGTNLYAEREVERLNKLDRAGMNALQATVLETALAELKATATVTDRVSAMLKALEDDLR